MVPVILKILAKEILLHMIPVRMLPTEKAIVLIVAAKEVCEREQPKVFSTGTRKTLQASVVPKKSRTTKPLNSLIPCFICIFSVITSEFDYSMAAFHHESLYILFFIKKE